MSTNDFNNVTAGEILKVAHWVHRNGGDEAIWKGLTNYANEIEATEEKVHQVAVLMFGGFNPKDDFEDAACNVQNMFIRVASNVVKFVEGDQ